MKRTVTSRGVVLSGSALVMLAVGLFLSDGELITLGLCGILLVCACYVLAPLNLQGLELTAQWPPGFFATHRVTALLKLHNRRRALNAWSVGITLRFPHKVERSGHAVWTRAQGSSALKVDLRIPSRAIFSKVDCEFHSRFPLGLFEVSQTSSVDCRGLVYPQLITPAELLLSGSRADLNPIAGASLGDLFGEPRGIRRYQTGDKATRIHQSASAHSLSRGQGLQVRAFDPPGMNPHRCRVVFHSYTKEGEIIRLHRFERALSLIAGTLAHFQATQTKVTLQADFNHWHSVPCETRAQYYECLALLAETQRAPQTQGHELAEILQRTPSDEQLIVISDALPEHWAELVPPAHRHAVLVDIRQVRFKPRKIQLQLFKAS